MSQFEIVLLASREQAEACDCMLLVGTSVVKEVMDAEHVPLLKRR